MTDEEVKEAIALAQKTRSIDFTLSGEGLTSLPPEIGELTQIAKLNLKDNKLTSLPPEIGKLTNLKRLYLSNNKITELPPEIAQLQKLEIIYAGNNKLSTIPSEIGQLTNLQGLYLNDNGLTSLPPEIENLTNLRNFDLRKNNLPIPKELVEKIHQPASIIRYYLEYQSAEASHLYESKIIIIGSLGVGKSSVVQQLLEGKFNPYHIRTVGLNKQNLTREYNQNQANIQLWDFGGTVNMHPIYDCAFSQNSLYLIVTEGGEDPAKLDYWFNRISSITKKAPIVLVINKIDEGLTILDKTSISRNYSEVKNINEVSCKKQLGLEYLKTVITQQVEALINLNSETPPNWIAMKEKIAALETPFISFEEYQQLCKQEVILEEKEQKDLANLLADIGVIIYRPNYLIKPEWFINNLELIFNDMDFQQETQGIVSANHIQTLLELPNLQQARFFLDIIENLELGFSTETPDTIIIPNLLNSQEPATGDWENSSKVEYQYPVFSPQIIPRLTVRMKKYIEANLYWRDGVVFNNRGDRVIVKANPQTQIISVTGNPETQTDFLKSVCSQLEKVNQLTPGITANKLKPKSKQQPISQTPPLPSPSQESTPLTNTKPPNQPPLPSPSQESTPSNTTKASHQPESQKSGNPKNKWILYGGLFIGTIVIIVIISTILS